MTKENNKPHDETAAVWVETGRLVPWSDNPRLNDEAVEQVEISIRRFGFSSPIIARREDSTVIAGHTRLAAAKRLGLDRVPVRFLDLDPADAKLLALADNRLGEIARWDLPALSSILKDLDADLDLTVAGFSEEELADLLRDEILLPDGSQIDDPKEAISETIIEVRSPLELSAEVIERVQAAVEGYRGRGVSVDVS